MAIVITVVIIINHYEFSSSLKKHYWIPTACRARCVCEDDPNIALRFSSVVQSCLALCDPMDCSTPGLPVYHQLPEFTQTHVHWVGDAISSCVFPFSSCLQSFPASESVQMSQLFTSGGQTIGVLASASVLPMNIQDWFPWFTEV